ncbi:MAG: hypothetical protein WCB19_06115, partial [Thermoplasmata archaeon]
SWRRGDCGSCQGSWHRDRAAAIVILDRGLDVLRGAAPPPSARNALLEAASWRPAVDDESTLGPTTRPTKEDDAKDFGSMRKHQFKEEQRLRPPAVVPASGNEPGLAVSRPLVGL